MMCKLPQSFLTKLKNRRLMIALFLPALTLISPSCGQDFNSNSGDRPVTSEVCKPGSNSLFCQSLAIYQADCFSCHSEWAEFSDEQAWVDSGLVVPGDIGGSKAINRLINYGSDMPLGGSALSAEEYKTLTDWVQQIDKK